MPRVRCLSVRQPYASAILTGQKTEEYRSWPTNHRGLLAIHASKTVAKEAIADYPDLDMTTGAVLGIVEVTDCIPLLDGTYAWTLANPQLLDEPIAAKGNAGFFYVDLE